MKKLKRVNVSRRVLVAWGLLLALTTVAQTSSPLVLSSIDRFMRAHAGWAYNGGISLMLFCDGGSFGPNLSPSVSFPRSINSYTAGLEIEADRNESGNSVVVFTSPPGLGLTNTPAQFSHSDRIQNYTWYQAPQVTSIIPTGGVWQVRYLSRNLSYNLSPPEANTRLVLPLPTVTVANDVVQRVTWNFKNATTGANYTSVPGHLTQVQVQVDGFSAGRIYNSDWMPPAAAQHTLVSPVYWSSVSSLNMVYDDTLGNHYVVFFRK